MTKIEDFGTTAMRRMPWWRKFDMNYGTTAKRRMRRRLCRECGNKNAAFHPFFNETEPELDQLMHRRTSGACHCEM